MSLHTGIIGCPPAQVNVTLCADSANLRTYSWTDKSSNLLAHGATEGQAQFRTPDGAVECTGTVDVSAANVISVTWDMPTFTDLFPAASTSPQTGPRFAGTWDLVLTDETTKKYRVLTGDVLVTEGVTSWQS